MIKTLLASVLLVSNIGLDWLTSKFDTYDKIQKQIHEYAEPGYMEYKSSELFIEHLEENGFKVERGVAGMPTETTLGECWNRSPWKLSWIKSPGHRSCS